MTACRDVEPLLLDRAAGDLDPAGAERLDQHLAGCAACRAEAAALDRTLSLVRLPPPDAAERAALSGLADSVRAARTAAVRRRAWPVRFAAGLAVAAAAAAFLVAPAFTRRAPTLTPEEEALARAAATPTPRWAVPDPDELWDTAGALLSDEVASEAAAPAASTATPLARQQATAIAAADAWFDTDSDTTTAR
jgi:anti-sigma factor RsiW